MVLSQKMKREDCMKNDVVVILSVYLNDELSDLQECLNSLYSQTYQAFDIFIQFDGVVKREIEEYIEGELQNKKIKFLSKRAENRGLAYSLNELLEKSFEENYTYYVRMDADDISVPSRLQQQIDFMQDNKQVDLCGGFIEEFNTDNGRKQVVKYYETHTAILSGMKKRNAMAHVTVCFRKSFFEKTGLYDVSCKNEDYDLWIRGLKAGCIFHNIQEVLVQVRVNDAFYERRKDIHRAYEVMLLKFEATKSFHFGMSGYLYAIAHFILFMAPGRLKQFVYKNLRD